MRTLQSLKVRPVELTIPFYSWRQRRWKKKFVESAQTRLENRTRDTQLDKLSTQLTKLNIILKLHELMTRRKQGHFVSVQIMSRWRRVLGLSVGIGEFLGKHRHVFDVFSHPLRHNICCRFSGKMMCLYKEEENAVKKWELEAVKRIKKLLMMSVNGSLHVHALRLVRRELGLPPDFRECILAKYSNEFKLVDLEFVELVDRDHIDEELGSAEIEQWREREYKKKWLSEYDTMYAFPINFPTGFKIEGGFREKLRNWQRLPYMKPYERKEVVRVRSCGGEARYEKRAVGILHEFLSLTVEKMVEVEKLAHFRSDFAMVVNVRELLLNHPGVFYISTKVDTQRVFLREAYSRGSLVESNPIYVVRRKMLDIILMGCRHTRKLQAFDTNTVDKDNVVCKEAEDAKGDGDWVIPMLESLSDRNTNDSLN